MKNKKRQNKKNKQPSAFGKALNRFMPYILSVIAAFVLFALSGLAGAMGDGIRAGLYGTFSNFATYFFPIFLIYHAIMWNYDIKRKICARRVVCSVITLMCFSTMQYLIQVGDYEELNSYSASVFFNMGRDSIGGGFVGGVFGKLLLNMGGVIGVILITLILVFMILQMFNITPAYMIRSMIKNKKPEKKKRIPVKARPDKKIKPTNPKKIAIYDDGNTEDNDVPPAYLDKSRLVSLDDTDELDDLDDEVKPNNGKAPKAAETSEADNDLGIDAAAYEELSIDKIHKRTEHIPSQLQPYNEEAELEISAIKYETGVDEEPPFESYEDTDELVAYDEPEYEEGYGNTEEENEQDEEYAPVIDEEPLDVDDDVPFDVYEDEAPFDAEDEEIDCTKEFDSEDFDSEEDFDEEEDDTAPCVENVNKSYIPEDILTKATAKPMEKPVNKLFTPVAVPTPKKEEKKEPKAPKPKINYTLPPLYFLKSQPDNSNSEEVRAELQENAKIIVDTLNDFKAPTRIVDVTRGPTITRYELQPEKGVRVSKIESLVNDIALNLAAKGIRIECPIPGKNAIGIEVPNRTISFVYLRDLIEDPRFERAQSKLTCALGKSIAGENIYVDIESTPHLLVAGATGMGKSVCINSLLVSLLYKAKPDDVRLILIDPKRVELSNYNGIPHLLVPVVCEPKKSLGALQWAVTEMEERFMAIEEAGVRNIKEFNQKVEKGYNAETMSRIVIVIDELADLKMAVPDIEGHITRLTQKARAAGIHIIIGTQRPSVDVLTGLIKNNIPSRIAFRVPSQVDSRTILDEVGADKLVAKGDMLVKIVGALSPVRVQGAYVSVDEIQDVIDYWKDMGPDNYDEEVMQKIENNAAKLAKNDKDVGEGDSGDGDELDPAFWEALGIAVDAGKISSSLLMRKLSLGFGRASRVIDQMESLGYIGEQNGTKPRDVILSKTDYQEIMMRRNDC